MNMCHTTGDPIIVNIESNNVAQPEAKLHNALYTWQMRSLSFPYKANNDSGSNCQAANIKSSTAEY